MVFCGTITYDNFQLCTGTCSRSSFFYCIVVFMCISGTVQFMDATEPL